MTGTKSVKTLGRTAPMPRSAILRHTPCSLFLLLLLEASLTAPWAAAQSTSDDARRDAERARVDAAVATDRGSLVSQYALVDRAAVTAAPSPTDIQYSLSLFAPVYFNTNAEAVRTGGTETIEGNPEVRFALSKLVVLSRDKGVTFSSLVDASSDRFVRSNSADGDSSYADLRAQFTNPNNDQALAPFVEYSPALAFEPTFSARSSTAQDLTMGFDKAWNRDACWKRVPARADTSRATRWSLGLTGTITRRFMDPEPSLYIVSAIPSLTYTATDTETANTANAQWNASLEVIVKRRLFAQQNGVSQRDWLVEPILTVELIPPLSLFPGEDPDKPKSRTRLGSPKIDFQVALTQLDSNVVSAQYRQWAIGPIIKLAWSL